MGHKSHLNGPTTTVGRGTNYSLVDNRCCDRRSFAVELEKIERVQHRVGGFVPAMAGARRRGAVAIGDEHRAFLFGLDCKARIMLGDIGLEPDVGSLNRRDASQPQFLRNTVLQRAEHALRSPSGFRAARGAAWRLARGNGTRFSAVLAS